MKGGELLVSQKNNSKPKNARLLRSFEEWWECGRYRSADVQETCSFCAQKWILATKCAAAVAARWVVPCAFANLDEWFAWVWKSKIPFRGTW